MGKFRSKMKKQGGFTLIEMLIVVAIIAILIAVSIPLVGTALERARKATDAANERSAKAEALIMYMTNGVIEEGSGGADDDLFEAGVFYWYNAVDGCLEKDADGEGYGKCNDHHEKNLWVAIGDGKGKGDADVVYLRWEDNTVTSVDTFSSTDLDSLDLVAE